LTLTKFVSRWNLAESRVNRDSNIISGVSLVSLGEARGHNKRADETTLQQVRDCAKQYKGGLRVRFNPYTFNHGDAGLAGFISPDSIEVRDGRVIGDMHVYATFPHKDYLYEIAERAPDNFGLSIEFNGDTEQVGEEFFARCDEIFAATVVDLPAANPTGLFAAKDEQNLTKIREGIKNARKINQDNAPMTPEEQKALAKEIADTLKPVLQEFRAKQGNTDTVDTSPATPEEEAAAGCTDDMTPEQKASCVNEWRKKANSPVTQKDLMSFFRMTGGKPVTTSGQGEGAKDDETDFSRTVRKYVDAGMSQSKAIARAAHDNRRGYNEWCQKGRPTIKL
jgi:hypothetical protein